MEAESYRVYQNQMMNQMMSNLFEKINNNKKIDEKHNGITVIFRKGRIKSEDISLTIIECYSDEIVSEIIKRYIIKTGDIDENKKYIFNGKNLNPMLTVGEAGITNHGNIFVVETKGIKGRGYPMLFSDVSKNKTKEIGFSKKAPSYRKACKGINIFGICHCKKCIAYKKEVVVKIKEKKFDLINEKDKLFCPECESIIIPKTVGFYLCKFRIYGKKIVGDNIERFENDDDEANNKKSLKYFDPELNGETMVSELIFEVIKYF